MIIFNLNKKEITIKEKKVRVSTNVSVAGQNWISKISTSYN